MKLIPIADRLDDAQRILYQLLEERDPSVNISHRVMPTELEHIEHVTFNSAPFQFIRKGERFSLSHRDWCLAVVGDEVVGAIYLSAMNELGPGVLKAHQRRGYGEAMCRAMMAKHGSRRYLQQVADDREHVTPWMQRQPDIQHACLSSMEDRSHLRWTLDTLEDYTTIWNVFEQQMREAA